MSSWRDRILREFTPEIARLTLVADPDGLLLEEGVMEGIRERGYELIPFDDPVAFRYAYESRFRARWDRGEESAFLVVVLRSPSGDLDVLPYDLLQAGRKLSFSLADLFPQLSYPVVAALDRADLDALYEAQARHAPGRLGDNATKDFVLRHVFDIAAEVIRRPPDLLRVLLRRHYRGQRIPAILDEHLIEVLRQNDHFKDWPLDIIVPDREAFFAFLQERWPIFLDVLAKDEGEHVHEVALARSFALEGPPLLPFDHPDVRVYLDNLFIEGLLQPVPHAQAETLAGKWGHIGVVTSPAEHLRRRIEGLLDSIPATIPAAEARYGEWLHFAYRWAELVSLVLAPDTDLLESYRERLEVLKPQIDAALTAWVRRRYAGLTNLPPAPPVMVHHMPRFLARGIADDPRTKVAFLLIDGLSLDQWVALRDVMGKRDPALRFREQAVFAWIPTITSVSRQAAFAGKPPFFFPASIHTTEKEPSLWSQFWMEQGLSQNEVAYAKGLGDGDLGPVRELLEQPQLRVVGLVIDKVDRIMHGMELGAAGMHNQVRQWTKQGFLLNLIGLLHDNGFRVYLSSDHGNVEAVGIGRPAEGVTADLRGERVRVYRDPALRSQVRTRFPDALEWDPVALPEDFLPLIAPGRYAFVQQGKRIVAHGGITLEELIVPFVEIVRSDQ